MGKMYVALLCFLVYLCSLYPAELDDVDMMIIQYLTNEKNRELISSILKKDTNEFRKQVDKADKTVLDTGLAVASLTGDLPAVKLAVEKGGDVNARIKTLLDEVYNPLYLAVVRENAEVAKYLIDNGADVNVDLGVAGTVLRNACFLGSSKMIQLLIANGAEADKEGKDGYTPLLLLLASSSTDINTVKLMIDKGADLKHVAKDGTHALLCAAMGGDPGIVGFVIKAGVAKVNQAEEHGYTPLMQTGSIEVAELLLKHGAEINLQNNEGYTALMLSLIRGNYDKAVFLISKNADVNIPVKQEDEFFDVPDGATPLVFVKHKISLLKKELKDIEDKEEKKESETEIKKLTEIQSSLENKSF